MYCIQITSNRNWNLFFLFNLSQFFYNVSVPYTVSLIMQFFLHCFYACDKSISKSYIIKFALHRLYMMFFSKTIRK